jgi:hypothetical protein
MEKFARVVKQTGGASVAHSYMVVEFALVYFPIISLLAFAIAGVI